MSGSSDTLRPLKPKQQRFVDEYVIDVDPTAACRRAGYAWDTATSQASRLLSQDNIKAAVAIAQKEHAERNKVTVDKILETIKETVDRCRQASPVVNKLGEQVYAEDREGQLRPVYKFDANNVLKGAELLGKYLGMFESKTEKDSEVPLPVQINIGVVDGRKPSIDVEDDDHFDDDDDE